MNTAKVIENVRRKKAGYDVSDEFIIRAISRAEKSILLNVAAGREGDSELEGYLNRDIETDRNAGLFVKTPYDALYELFCCAQIDLEYEDSERYQNDLIAYNTLLEEYKAYYFAAHRQNKSYNWRA